jgi:hypothetical protein
MPLVRLVRGQTKLRLFRHGVLARPFVFDQSAQQAPRFRLTLQKLLVPRQLRDLAVRPASSLGGAAREKYTAMEAGGGAVAAPL